RAAELELVEIAVDSNLHPVYGRAGEDSLHRRGRDPIVEYVHAREVRRRDVGNGWAKESPDHRHSRKWRVQLDRQRVYDCGYKSDLPSVRHRLLRNKAMGRSK